MNEESPMPILGYRISSRWGGRVAVLLLAAMACRDFPSAPSAPSAPSLLLESSEPVILEHHVPVDFVLTNMCTGETFTGSGFDHRKVSFTTFPKFHMTVEENLEDAKGVTATGARYVVPAEVSSHQIMDTDFAPANGTTEESVQFIRQAEDGTLILGDDFYFRLKVHATVNAHGDVTVSFLDQTIDCK
jgi:hypothetical protein